MENTLKRCSCCREYKKFTEFHKKKSASDGLNCQCKQCVSLYGKTYYKNHAEERREVSRTYYKKNRIESLEYARQYRESHREETREYARKRRIDRPDEVRAINRASYRRNADKWRMRANKRREENPEYLIQYRNKNRESIRQKGRNYARSNLDTLRTNTQNYRARKRNAPNRHTVKDMRTIYNDQKGLCYYCAKPVSWKGRHDDHKIPVSRGGSNGPENLAVTCPTCNTSKGDKTAEEYIMWRKLHNK